MDDKAYMRELFFPLIIIRQIVLNFVEQDIVMTIQIAPFQ